MKTPCLFIAISLFSIHVLLGEIKNGYAPEIQNANQSLEGLKDQAATCLSNAERRKVESTIRELKNFICYYELTENLLNQFRTIAPALYHEVNSIKDKRGRPTDVFIKFIPMSSASVKYPGTTNLAYKNTDTDMYCSVYGQQTASIEIWITDNALTILSHELGHVRYQVPNLASYSEYYIRNYGNDNKTNYAGHNPSDFSGKSAAEFEKQFCKNYRSYLRSTGNKLRSPLAILNYLSKTPGRNRATLVKSRV